MNESSVTAPVENDEIDALAERIAQTAASLDAATHTLLTDLRAFDERQGWAKQGALSCAAWLSWKCGIAPGAAREKLRVAHALARLPLVDDELRRGQLSFSKVRAMTRVATPENEANLVEIALHSTAAQLEKICRIVDQLRPRDTAEPSARRWLRSRDTPDGMVRIEVQLLPEEASRVLSACDVHAESCAARLDGLLTMAEACLRGDQPDRPPTEVLLHIDAATLSGRNDDTGVSAETARRLLCDAGVAPVLEDANGQTVDVGRKTRTISPALRRALIARDGGCRFPGCSRRRFLHAHHVRHWVDGGPTSLANTLFVCTSHHALIHEGGFRIVGDRFIGPDGRDVSEVCEVAPRALPRVAPESIWNGEPVDYDASVGCLA